jgi:hypothetical protein
MKDNEIKTHLLVEVETLEELKENALFLECLRMAGVEQWEDYDDALYLYKEATGNRRGLQ